MEGDEAITEGPFLHRLIENDVLREDDNSNVLESAQSLQDLRHGFGFGFLHHGADSHHDLPLWRLWQVTGPVSGDHSSIQRSGVINGATLTLPVTAAPPNHFQEELRLICTTCTAFPSPRQFFQIPNDKVLSQYLRERVIEG